ncbi:GNAT family N-acetyltransferase [Shimia abyssi]|uniref:GNAT family N-acetyltransferase n=1 Tax=Shimia abyssi TaxID=1662395 RepID=UPI001FAE7FF1|nr:GNAT family N-acetyltransferase [Shimia abyssi]
MQRVLDATQLFPSDMLPDMVHAFLTENTPADLWLTCLNGEKVVGFCYAAPETFTEGTWNMLAIAVSPDQQGKGFGRALTRALEVSLKDRGHRVLIVDTSGSNDFAKTRAFYAQNHYIEEARIRDFWGPGDDKIIFWKSLK